jgi:aspartyl-tRNA(Asn)/glutamyl-tRNA(Gln) amidotransferase subunit A
MTSRTVTGLLADLKSGNVNASALVDQALARIQDPNGEGKRAFIRLYESQARALAAAHDMMAESGAPRPLRGIPISVKDLFDIAGETTTAGSMVLRNAEKARCDAPVVARLRAAGAVIVGTTNMSEFAFGGVGTNSHYGTPRNPYNRSLIPGGSSSGAAVSVADGMCSIAIGTDTGGSVRIPAAFCGLVGFKPTQARICRHGALPLSRTLDSIGPIGRTVRDCALIDSVMSGDEHTVSAGRPLDCVRFAIPETMVCEGLSPEVADAFTRACKALEKRGARLVSVKMPEIAEAPVLNSEFSPTEAYALHRNLLSLHESDFDPRVGKRILLRGSNVAAYQYLDMLERRAQLIEKFSRSMQGFDAVLMPTLPFTAPTFASVENDDDYVRINAQIVRNPCVVNQIDGCGITLPVESNGAPVGITTAGLQNSDRNILAIAISAEEIFNTSGRPPEANM